ncbi:DNA recombination protein RecN [Ureibacillus massiliensis 4400831 = CIP 108448 = CCUG 49529]|uniref:DNA repair protein RecN n=1 Tax=Ureibacillus massiliensis 4400831 = CIP 108448 = CCUG 49529 TaxID=1211035 RepID=A0A0A3J362_9BACL|nr:DNA repair protein RecN [Ureibacillus massiliensis]KGR91469.1 DNA recombination protein RecN [Ureibacillus massiliensis 4400831 = CIP 108448 = CCUG 49529]
MLTELSIRNFAIIDELSLSFSEGLTVLTGETGAGKSIIIDAVHLLAGGRASQDFIRHGANKAELMGLFQITNENQAIYEKLQEIGIEVEEDSVILQRDINEKGKSICRINGKLVPLSILREVGGKLVDIHGQHENQELMDEKQHIRLLDYYASNDITSVKEEYLYAYQTYRQLKKELAQLNIDEKRTNQRIDLYQFQIREIEEAKLQIGEEEALTEERRKLLNFNKIFERANLAYEAISGEMKGLDLIGDAMGALDDIVELDNEFKDAQEAVSSSFYSLQDAAHQIKSVIDDLEFHPERLNEVEHRLAQYQMLKRKYGADVEEILNYYEKIKDELDQLLNRDEAIRKTEQKLKAHEEQLEKLAQELTTIRKKNAIQLSESIMNQLRDLHMEKAKFIVNFDTYDHYESDGKDMVSFFISTNVGEPPKSLPKIASGGELSRIMLALKTIFSSADGVTSIIFDEVDTGVSGRVAQAIAEKIAAISNHSQVLCITHLPQVAAMADQHFLIRKEVDQNRTYTTVSNINLNERAEEISRMMSGAEITDLTLQHAKELLNLAEERKKEYKVKI